MAAANPPNPPPAAHPTAVESADRIAPRAPSPSPSPSSAERASKRATPEARRSQQFDYGRSQFDYEAAPPRRARFAASWQRLQEQTPCPLLRLSRPLATWLRGPQPPTVYHVQPLAETLQTAPVRLVARLPRVLRLALGAAAFVLWLVAFGLVITTFSLPRDIGGFGAPVRLSCTARLWLDSPSCGLDGRNCLPFDDSTFAFSCPADCAGVQLLNPRTVGDEQIVYRPLVVGGAPEPAEDGHFPYRGDSFICPAAIHAGVVRDPRGGCGLLSLVGEQSSFGAVERNGIMSVGFNSSFPLSFDFNRDEGVVRDAAKCRDPRWHLLVLSTIFTASISLFSSSPLAFFAPVFVIVYFQTAMASDPPPYADYPSLASTALGSFLPAVFIAVFIYRFSVRKTLANFNAHLEKTVLWLGACWVGALSNITLDMIPIQRLTPHDLNQQPGAITALVFIVLIIAVIAIFQAWCFRNEGRLPRYLALYAVLGIGLLILLAIPNLDLRIHHYILALLLLPGTSLQTRTSLLFQGLLVGLFINGVARWGFAPILQTAASLRGDAQLGYGIPSILPPTFSPTTSNITFEWDHLLRGYEGVSVLVNDVERFRGFHKNGDNNFTWTRRAMDHPEFFRFGFVNYLPFGGVTYSDFTRAGTWWPDGRWTDIPPGLG